MVTGACQICPHVERWPSDIQAKLALVWHVYEEHPVVWHEFFGGRPPLSPRPKPIIH